MHGRANGLRSDIYVAFDRTALSGIRDHEAVPVAMHGQASGDEILLRRVLGQRETITTSLDQATAVHHRLQPFGELPPLVTTNAHFADELLVSRRAVRLALDVPKNGLVANQCVPSRKDPSGVCTPFPPVSRFTLKGLRKSAAALCLRRELAVW